MIALKKYFLFFTFLCSLSFLKAQFGGYTGCDWDKIKVDPNYVPTPTDTAIVFVSVRNYFPEKLEYLDYDLDSTGTLHYFSIYFNLNQWTCVPRKSLEETYANAPQHKDIVVYAEGMGKTFTSNVDRATRFTRIYDVVTVMFDWPTYRPYLKGGKNFRLAKNQSAEAAKPLSKLFDELEKLKSEGKFGPNKLSMIFHSLGNRLIKEAVINNNIKIKTKLFDNIILNAACVKMRGHKKWLEKLNIQDKIYVTRNNRDRSLALARIAGFSKQLGMHNRWRKAENAIYLNFSKVLKREHNYFLMTNVLKAHPEIKNLYSDLFHAKNISFDDQAKFKKRKEGHIITLIKPHVSQDGDIGLSIGM
jgi:hypothetical protein